VMPVMVTVSGSLSGSVRPRIDTATNAWLGGQSSAGFGRAPLQTGGALARCRVVGVGSTSVVVVGSKLLVVELLVVVEVLVDVDVLVLVVVDRVVEVLVLVVIDEEVELEVEVDAVLLVVGREEVDVLVDVELVVVDG